MTVASTSRVAGPYVGTGADAALPFAFKVFAATDLLVTRNGTELTYSTDYTVTLNADQDASPGGTVNIVAAAYLSLEAVWIESDVAATQQTSITNLGGFFPKVIEQAFDRITMVVQQLLATTARAIYLPRGESALAWPSVASRAGKFAAWGSGGEPTVADSAIALPAIASAVTTLRGSTVDAELKGFSTRAALKALTGASKVRAYLTEQGRSGSFTYYTNADFAARFTITGANAAASDANEGIWLRSGDGNGVWVRDFASGAIWQASWFGWSRNSDGGTGAGNRDAIRAIEALINSSSGGTYPFGPGDGNTNQMVDLGYGVFDLGAAGDAYGLRRVRGNYFGRGFLQTQINWTGDASGTMIQWENVRRGFFNQCWLTYSGNKPKRYIDTSYTSGLAGQHVCDWSDNFDNMYGEVTSDTDACAVYLWNIVNFTFHTARFSGGTRHIYVLQPDGASDQRGLRVENYTFDSSNSAAAAFKDCITVDVTGTGSLAVTLVPTRCEGGQQPATNAAIVRVTDTVGPNNIGLYAVTLNIEGGAGWQMSHASSAMWVVYHDTTQTTCFTPIHIPHGVFLNGFQGIAGGNWNLFIDRWEPTFSANVQMSPYSNDPRQDNFLGVSARTTGPIYFGSGTAARVGTILTNNGTPEAVKTANPGSICMVPAAAAGAAVYRKVSGTGNTGWVNISQTKGAITGSTDASGDVTITHGFGFTPTKVDARIDGTTLYGVQCHTIGSSTFKVRVFNPTTGAAVLTTAVTGWWEAETTS